MADNLYFGTTQPPGHIAPHLPESDKSDSHFCSFFQQADSIWRIGLQCHQYPLGRPQAATTSRITAARGSWNLLVR